MKFKKGDTVKIIAGKDSGAEGEIIDVLPKANKVVVDGRNVAKRHTMARSQNQKSDNVEKPMPIDASNVLLVHKGKPTRVGYKIDKNGKKVRIAKSTGEEF